ncbi:MAG: serine hydrolase [Acidobacteria bacterium]|nr:serine hydrolase [Acidobacteriota bacterium]
MTARALMSVASAVIVLALGFAAAAPAQVAVPVEPRFESVVALAKALPRLRSLLVSEDGALVLERYFNGARATTAANVKSASKSILSALVGRALMLGHVASVSTPISTYLPVEMAAAVKTDARKAGITIEHLLTMKTGLESTSGRNYGPWVRSANWVRFALARPMIADPGTAIEYSTGNSHVLSAVLTRATKQTTFQFAQTALAGPLGFRLSPWPRDPQGIYFGGNDMLLTPRQMVAIGELYLNDGRLGDTRLFPDGWVAATATPRGRSRWGSDREYGYGWWTRSLAGTSSFYAWGYGGQFIFVVPDRRLVIVTTSDPNVSQERRDHLDAIYEMAERIVSGIG